MATERDDLPSLRIVPLAARQAELNDLVRYHAEELNLLEERWPPEGDSPSENDLTRARLLRKAAHWERTGFLAGVARFLEEGRGVATEAFGPAWLVLSLGAERQAPFERWLATVSPQVMKRVARLLDLTAQPKT